MKMKEKIIDFVLGLQFIFRPSFWIMSYSYNSLLDDKLKSLMDEKFTNFDSYTAKLGGIELWVVNYPYACMTFCGGGGSSGGKIRPSRLTILRLHKKYMREYLEFCMNK